MIQETINNCGKMHYVYLFNTWFNVFYNVFYNDDKFLKRLTDIEDEFEIMKLDINRLKKVIREKLKVDLI